MTAPQIVVTACTDGALTESDREASDDGGGSLGPSAVALEPLEKEWLQGAASGHMATLSHLLQKDPMLASKKDFTSGFTALHWAAKQGHLDLVTLLLDAGAEVNVRAHGGYTPLHIAALHGHQRLMELLIWTYGAKPNIRDYSGRLARHYLRVEPPSGALPAPQLGQARAEHSRNRKLACLLPKSGVGGSGGGSSQARRRWGSANDLAEEEEAEQPRGGPPPHLALPPIYRAVRKFSR